ncbi:MAG: hypothetical protein ACPGRX_00785 [Bdellovibrionales bacterium]
MGKLVFEILLTVVCIALIFIIAQRFRSGDVDPAVALAVMPETAAGLAEANAGIGLSGAGTGQDDVYDAANGTAAYDQLKAMADQEAERMLRSGDTSRYRDALDRSGFSAQ